MSNYLLDSSRGPVSVDPHEYWLRERKIFIEGEITPSLTNDVIRQIMYLEKDSTDKGITIFVNSPGGDVTAGLSVFDCITTRLHSQSASGIYLHSAHLIPHIVPGCQRCSVSYSFFDRGKPDYFPLSFYILPRPDEHLRKPQQSLR